MKPNNLLKTLGVFLAGCLVALAVLEVLLRVYNPLEIRFRPDRIVLPVNKRYSFNNADKFTKLPPTTKHTKNSLGFRGAPPPRDFQDYLTIITIGGSTTECFYLSDGRTWPDLLGQNLSRQFNRVWVNNAGLDGATTYRHLILMEDYVAQLRPKVVLFLIGINDVGAGDIAAAEQRRGHDLRHRWHALLNRSEVYALGQNLYRYFVAQSRGLHHTQVDLRAAGTLDQLPSGTASRMLRDYETNSLPFFAARLSRLVKVCRDHGIEPVLITQPTLYGPGVDPVTGVDLGGDQGRGQERQVHVSGHRPLQRGNPAGGPKKRGALDRPGPGAAPGLRLVLRLSPLHRTRGSSSGRDCRPGPGAFSGCPLSILQEIADS